MNTKKPHLKMDEKCTILDIEDVKKTNQGLPKANTNPTYLPNAYSAQNLRPQTIVIKERDSPIKNQTSYKNIKRPQFLKNLSKGVFTQTAEERRIIAEERKSYKTGFLMNREDTTTPALDSKSKDPSQKIKVGKARQLRETIKADVSEFQKINEKLNYIQNKISELNDNIDKNREQKRMFLENEKKDRQKRLQKWSENQPEKNVLKESLKKFVTQVNEGKDYVSANFNPYSPKNHTYYVSELLKFYKDERSLAREHITMSTQYLRIFENIKVPTDEQIKTKSFTLQKKPQFQDKKTVIFDLDETLIHCNDTLDTPYDIKLKIKFPTGEEIEAGINIRPHAVEILKALSKNFEIIVFTASHSCYANVVLDHLDPKSQYIHHRLFRQHCYITPESVYVKDLRVINRQLSQMILIDNAAYSYAFQLDNAIPILPYYKGKNDYELKALQTYIEGMILAKDVRQINRKTFKLHRYKQFDNIEKLITDLYSQSF